jgi:HAD superfamily hydrolase (TIGR01509 family)
MLSIPPDLVIYDCDGVLVDSEGPANRVMCTALNALGLNYTVETTIARFVGRSMDSCVTMIEAELGRAVPDTFVDDLRTETFAAFEQELQPVSSIKQAIAAIDRPDCVASSGPFKKMHVTLGLTGLLDYFEGRIFSASQVERGKPHPDLFLFAADRMNTPPERCVVIEDSVPGVQAARAAGIPVFAYAGADHANAAALERAGAHVFTDMTDLPGLLLR